MSLLDKRFYFHVGAHQSGAALVQKYLSRHADFLFAGGVQYLTREQLAPVVGWGGKFANAPEGLAEIVARALRRRRTFAVVASHESTLGQPFDANQAGLYAASGTSVAGLATLAQSSRCIAVLSVRPQADFIEANYLRAVNEGTREPFDVWLSGIPLTNLSWMPIYERLVTALGSDNVRVLDYRRAEENQAAFMREFLAAIDVDVPIELPNRPAYTPTWSGRQLRMLLAANQHLTSGKQRGALRAFVRRQYRKKNDEAATLLSADKRAEIDGLYMSEYEDLVNTSVGRDR